MNTKIGQILLVVDNMSKFIGRRFFTTKSKMRWFSARILESGSTKGKG